MMARKGKIKHYPRVGKKRLEYLEWLIWNSRDADMFVRQCLIFMIRRSKGLTTRVKMTLRDGGRSARGICGMSIKANRTHVVELFGAVGAKIFPDYFFDGKVTSIISIVDPRAGTNVGIMRLTPNLAKIEAIEPADPHAA